MGLEDNSKRHILYKLCLLSRIVSKKNYTSFKFLNKQEKKQQLNLGKLGELEVNDNKILNKTIDREKFNEGSDFKVETIIVENSKINIWDISTDRIQNKSLKWQVWENNIIGAQFLIYCVDGSSTDENKLAESRDALVRLLSDKNLESICFAVLFNNMESIKDEEEQRAKLAKLKEMFSSLNCKQNYRLYGCSSKIIYNENPETMTYLNKNCNYTQDYSKLNKEDFKKYCKKDSLIEMIDWMVIDCLS